MNFMQIVSLTFLTAGIVGLLWGYGQDESAYKFAKYFAFFWGGVVVAGVV